VETLGASLAIGGVQEQIEPGDQCEETADTQQVDSDDDMDEDEQEDEYSSSDSRRPKVLHTPATRAAELTDRMKGGVHHNQIPVWRFEGRQVSTSGAKRDETKPVDDAEKSPVLAASVGYHSTIRPCVEGSAVLHPAALLSGAIGSKWRLVGEEHGVLPLLASLRRRCG